MRLVLLSSSSAFDQGIRDADNRDADEISSVSVSSMKRSSDEAEIPDIRRWDPLVVLKVQASYRGDQHKSTRNLVTLIYAA